MRLTYFGHSCFLLETNSHRLLFDPFLRENPCCPAGITPETLYSDAILISHGHEDHTGDALELSLRHGALIVANYEIAEYFASKGARTHGLNPGGSRQFPFGRVKLTIAHHTSSLEAGQSPIYMGTACGLVVEADGRRIYHAGDTAVFLDMQLIGRPSLDLALLPIGDNYTMGPQDALLALDFLRPKLAVPMHYNTWEVIEQDPHSFAASAAQAGHVVRPLAAGETLELG